MKNSLCLHHQHGVRLYLKHNQALIGNSYMQLLGLISIHERLKDDFDKYHQNGEETYNT